MPRFESVVPPSSAEGRRFPEPANDGDFGEGQMSPIEFSGGAKTGDRGVYQPPERKKSVEAGSVEVYTAMADTYAKLKEMALKRSEEGREGRALTPEEDTEVEVYLQNYLSLPTTVLANKNVVRDEFTRLVTSGDIEAIDARIDRFGIEAHKIQSDIMMREKAALVAQLQAKIDERDTVKTVTNPGVAGEVGDDHPTTRIEPLDGSARAA